MQQQMKRLLKNKKTTIALLSFIVVTIVICVTTYESTKKNITLVENGKVKEVQTHADTVDELLKSQNIALTSHDKIAPSKNQVLSDHMKVFYEKAQKISFTLNDKKKTVWTTAETVQDFFNAHHIAIKAHDQIKPAPNVKITSGMAVSYDPSFQINVQVGKQSEKLWSNTMTVGEFLNQNHISLSKYDRLSPAKEETITPQTKVVVIRVKKVTDVVKAPLKAKTITREMYNLARGEQEVLTSGNPGTVEKHFEVTYENGKEVSRHLVSQKVLQESKNKIIALGTKAVSHIEPMSYSTQSVSRSSSQDNSNVIYVNSTAYTANCAGCSGLTTTGINLKANPNAKVIAVDPSVIPLGSKVYVEGYGYAVAGDTGGAINGNKIDVFFSSKSAASRWGSHTVKVKVIN